MQTAPETDPDRDDPRVRSARYDFYLAQAEVCALQAVLSSSVHVRLGFIIAEESWRTLAELLLHPPEDVGAPRHAPEARR